MVDSDRPGLAEGSNHYGETCDEVAITQGHHGTLQDVAPSSGQSRRYFSSAYREDDE
jgi:hypothetical protein